MTKIFVIKSILFVTYASKMRHFKDSILHNLVIIVGSFNGAFESKTQIFVIVFVLLRRRGGARGRGGARHTCVIGPCTCVQRRVSLLVVLKIDVEECWMCPRP